MTSLRDRLLTPAGARALTTPSAIVLAGVGASAGILAGLPAGVAALIGAAAWAGRVAIGLPRVTERPRIEPRRLNEPWRTFVRDALDSQVRFRRAIATASTGAIRERLSDIGKRVDDGVEECWRSASHGNALDEALRNLEPPDELRARLEQLGPATPGSANERVAESLLAQLESTARIAAVAEDARERLRILDARLDEAIARAIELSLRAGEAVELGGLGSDVDALVADMEALRQALDETSGAARAV
jgi:hypothetical protein